MNEKEIEQLKYPIGKVEWNENPLISEFNKAIEALERFPNDLKKLTLEFTEEMLQYKYRPGSWNIAQIVHHLADSHLHSYIRLKYAVLENTPTIKSYNEMDWANTFDGKNLNISYSLALLESLHKRYVVFIKSLTKSDFQKKYFHPERNKFYPVGTTLLIYAWHGQHHIAHIKNVIQMKFIKKKPNHMIRLFYMLL